MHVWGWRRRSGPRQVGTLPLALINHILLSPWSPCELFLGWHLLDVPGRCGGLLPKSRLFHFLNFFSFFNFFFRHTLSWLLNVWVDEFCHFLLISLESCSFGDPLECLGKCLEQCRWVLWGREQRWRDLDLQSLLCEAGYEMIDTWAKWREDGEQFWLLQGVEMYALSWCKLENHRLDFVIKKCLNFLKLSS